MRKGEGGWPSARPDEEAVNYLIEEISGGLTVKLGYPPEAELDAMLVGCELLRKHKNPGEIIGEDILEIEYWDRSGIAVMSDVWSEFSRDEPDYTIQIDGRICGIQSLMLTWAIRGEEFDLECVYKNGAEDASDADIGSRIWRWCSAVVTLGDSMMASRVEVPGQRGPEPIVLWRRQPV